MLQLSQYKKLSVQINFHLAKSKRRRGFVKCVSSGGCLVLPVQGTRQDIAELKGSTHFYAKSHFHTKL
jgi:hypothetical protein